MINLIAAQSLPTDMPAFVKTRAAIHEISYLGPEPDRWTQRGLEPELASTTGPDHFIRLELAEKVGSLPRSRYGYLKKLEGLRHRSSDAPFLTAQQIGTLPWEAEEIFERLEAAFHNYRIANGEFTPKDYAELAPMDKADLADIEASVLFYAGWLGHYIGDGCMPLHTSVNIAGWVLAENPHGYTRNGGIHHKLEEIADANIEQGKIEAGDVQSLVKPPQRLEDPFLAILQYLKHENRYVEDVYRFEQQGKLSLNTQDTTLFIDARMSEGASMLRDLIYTAWIDSAPLSAPQRNREVNFTMR